MSSGGDRRNTYQLLATIENWLNWTIINRFIDNLLRLTWPYILTFDWPSIIPFRGELNILYWGTVFKIILNDISFDDRYHDHTQSL